MATAYYATLDGAIAASDATAREFAAASGRISMSIGQPLAPLEAVQALASAMRRTAEMARVEVAAPAGFVNPSAP